jgi:hypothetical protein
VRDRKRKTLSTSFRGFKFMVLSHFHVTHGKERTAKVLTIENVRM